MGLLGFLPKVNNFLCCLSLHTGLVFSGISFLIWNILIILQNEDIINLKVKGYDHYGGADTTTMCAIAIIFCICLLIGVSNNNKFFLTICVWFLFALIIFGIVLTVKAFINEDHKTGSILLLTVLLEFYVLICSNSYLEAIGG